MWTIVLYPPFSENLIYILQKNSYFAKIVSMDIFTIPRVSQEQGLYSISLKSFLNVLSGSRPPLTTY